ncbi:MAG: IS3 family transposase, partial [Actinomycetota bacterium]|nr:IS3 family transposase [Actinomycetota bacterium]
TRHGGMTPWRAGCGESCTSGSEGGPGRPTGSDPGTAPRSDPYTYIKTGEGWLFLASVLDLGSRRLLGWQMDDNMATPLVTAALDQAVTLRGGARGVIYHSDRGSQYLSKDYRNACIAYGISQSAGRVATCFDNSVAEAFWSSLKRELVHRYRFATRAEAKAAVTAWIRRYNTTRLHSSLGYVPPVEWEIRYRRQQLQAA